MNCKIMKIKCVGKRSGQNLRILQRLLLGVFVTENAFTINMTHTFIVTTFSVIQYKYQDNGVNGQCLHRILCLGFG